MIGFLKKQYVPRYDALSIRASSDGKKEEEYNAMENLRSNKPRISRCVVSGDHWRQIARETGTPSPGGVSGGEVLRSISIHRMCTCRRPQQI